MATVWRPDGSSFDFNLVNGVWIPDPDVTAQLTQSSDGSSWIYTLPNNTREYFTSTGSLTSIRNRDGLTQTLTYDADGVSFTVTGPAGDTLHVVMNSNGVTPQSITDSLGNITSYIYDTTNLLLQKVTFPDTKTRQYLYEMPLSPQLVTGIIDENGNRSNTVAYDYMGHAVVSSLANGAELATVAYNSDGTTTVTNALGKQKTYTFTTINGVRKITQVVSAATATSPSSTESYAYDSNGFLTQKTDALGVITQYTRDSNGLELSRTEATGTANAHTITTSWDTAKRLPLTITQGNRVTTFSYDGDGRLLSRTVSDTSLGQSRTTSYGYNAFGLLATVDGPRTDVSDVTTYGYNGNGLLATVTNALGQVTTILNRDADGRPTLITDPNGLQTTLSYDSRGRLVSYSSGTETTTIIYDGVGNVTQVSPPDGATLSYGYDAANHLIKITDASGNYISYSLDAQGNRTAINTYNSGGSQVFKQTRVYDDLSRLLKSIGASSQTTLYSYDKNDNRITTTDPLGHLYLGAYDALNRLVQQTDPLSGTTSYAYDSQDHLASATDPNGHATSYSYNALGDLLSQTSPDTGTTTYSYDSAGNRISRTDANGQTTSYSYDALNRITQQLNADSSIITWDYDTAVNGIGRLTVSSSPSGTTSYSYDSHGRIATRVESIANNGHTTLLTTSYSYNSNGQLSQMTYPSGKVIGYQYNTKGQLIGLTLNGSALLSNITWQPFGPVKSWSWSNASYTRNFNTDYRLTSISSSWNTYSLAYDANGNITSNGISGNTSTNTYDALNRLTASSNPSFNFSWTYDINSNRTSLGSSWGELTYTLDTNSNKLLTVGTTNYQYDNNGSVTNDTAHSYQYDAQGRLVTVDNGSTGKYSYNANGQRTYKWAMINGTAQERLFDYDGYKLLGEYDTSGNTIQETVWLGDLPIATLQGGAIYKIYPDHLGTPRFIANPSNTIIWNWYTEPFGSTAANEDPDNNGVKFTYNLRFPGQYFDAETGKHYNYFRDYDPGTGRYVESDPIGLNGGMNTFAYVYQNTLSFSDYRGLDVWRCKRPVDGQPGEAVPPIKYHEYLCAIDNGVLHCGSTTPTTPDYILGTPGRPTNYKDGDYFDAKACENVDKGDENPSNCVERCVIREIDSDSRPMFAIGPMGTDCQQWSEETLETCLSVCSKKHQAWTENFSRTHPKPSDDYGCKVCGKN